MDGEFPFMGEVGAGNGTVAFGRADEADETVCTLRVLFVEGFWRRGDEGGPAAFGRGDEMCCASRFRYVGGLLRLGAPTAFGRGDEMVCALRLLLLLFVEGFLQGGDASG